MGGAEAGTLRRELARASETYARERSAPYFYSLGRSPTILFESYESGALHGNFLDVSYQAILRNPSWRRRLEKPHPRKDALPEEKRASARELDSSASSDALLMNIFCHPGLSGGLRARWFGPIQDELPEFGCAGAVPLVDGTPDTTEIDMRLGHTIVEAKLTEVDFTSRPRRHVERYAHLADVFEVDRLPQNERQLQGYQLIRNVLAARAHGWAFLVACDARRPDLLRTWWRVHSAIREGALRERCGFVLWQEVAQAAPADLRRFLATKYGIGGDAAEGALDG